MTGHSKMLQGCIYSTLRASSARGLAPEIWHCLTSACIPILPVKMSSPKAGLLEECAEKGILQSSSICRIGRRMSSA